MLLFEFNEFIEWDILFYFFMSSTMLYSLLSETTKVLGGDGELDEEGISWLDVEVYFLLTALSLARGVEGFYFWIQCIRSAGPLVLVLTGSTSCSFSLSYIGRMKSHILFNSTICSSWNSSTENVASSSSSSSISTFYMVFGGRGLVGWFLLNSLNGFLEVDSATCFLISTISLDNFFRTLCNPSRSKGS